MQLPKFLQHILTEPDNITYCPVRIIGIVGCLQYLVIEAHNYIVRAQFDPQAFALGFGGMIAGVGAAMKLKKDTPPASAPDSSQQ